MENVGRTGLRRTCFGRERPDAKCVNWKIKLQFSPTSMITRVSNSLHALAMQLCIDAVYSDSKLASILHTEELGQS
jgi:hypothetical protein